MSDAGDDPDGARAYAGWRDACARGDGPGRRAALDALAGALFDATRPLAAARAANLRLEAQDLLHDAWRRLQGMLEAQPPAETRPGFPRTLFVTILINLANDLFDRRREVRSVDAAAADPDERHGADPVAMARQAERVELVERVLAAMVGGRRTAHDPVSLLRAHYLEGLSAPELAERLGRSVGAVEQALRRARQAFRRAAEDEGLGLGEGDA